VLFVFNRGDDGDETDGKTKLFDGSCGLGDKMGALGTGTDTMSQKAGDSSFCTLAAGRGVSRSSPLQGREGGSSIKSIIKAHISIVHKRMKVSVDAW